MEYERLHQKAIGCMRLGSLITGGIFFLILVAARIVLIRREITLPLWAEILFSALLLLIVLYILISPGIRYRRYRYHIDEEQVIVVEGLWFITKDMAPIERIHQISIKRGPVLRAYGLSQVSCITAGGIVEISYLEESRAEEIAALLQRRIKSIIDRQRAEVDPHA